MPWFKIDDGFHGHPKVMELSPAAVGVWTLAGSWCANYLTDGEIKASIVRRFGADDAMVQELVEAGLWIDVGGAYQFKDWGDYQPLKADVEAERDAARERMKAVRAAKKGVERSPEQPPNNTGTFGGTSEEVRSTPTLPIPSLPPTTSPAASAADEFDEWYSKYPKKEAKENARKAFIKARKSVSLQELLSGLERYAASVKGKERQYIALPASWLNAGRWQDEITETPGQPGWTLGLDQ